MPMSAGSRLSSAVVRAALSTLVALASHVAAGGQMPTAPGLVVPLALSTAVCFQLAGKGLSLWRLSTAVLASQWIFHQLFVLGPGSATLTTTGGIHAGHDVGSISVHAAGHAHVRHLSGTLGDHLRMAPGPARPVRRLLPRVTARATRTALLASPALRPLRSPVPSHRCAADPPLSRALAPTSLE